MEKIFEGMVSENELVELSEMNQTEAVGGFPWGEVIEIVTSLLCPTSACTPRCK